MAQQPSAPGERSSAAVLAALRPLLQQRDAAVVPRVVSAVREAAAPQPALAAALYVFSKLVLPDPPAARVFRDVVNALVSASLLSRDALYRAIDVETHQLIEPAVDHSQEERRVRTRIWFTQTRFNLFREESEGYAKLVTLMWHCVLSYDRLEPRVVVQHLHAHIGQFNLDSNRVIELVLSAAADVLSEHIGHTPRDLRLPNLFACLLDQFAPDHVCSVMGAMLQSYHAVSVPAEKSGLEPPVATKQPPASSASSSPSANPPKPPATVEPEARTPQGIFPLIVVLIRERRMKISDIWHNLSPRDNSEIAAHFLQYEQNLQELKKHVTSVSVARQPNRQDLGIFQRTGTGASERDVFSQYSFIGAGPLATFSCQKLELIYILINMARWDDAMEAILSLDVDGEHIDIAAHPHLCNLLEKFVNVLMNPVLSNLYPSNYVKNTVLTEAVAKLGGRENGYPYPVMSVDDLLSEEKNSSGLVVRQILRVLGPHARQSPMLLHSVCRLLKGRNDPEAVGIMKEVILPSFSLLQSNLGLGSAIWDVIGKWSHNERWEIYGYLHNEVSRTCAVYQVVADRAAYEMKYILKRLTTENHKQFMKSITKICHGQAIPAFSAALDRIQGYPPDAVTISPVVEACRGCSELARDMLLYLIVDRMADSRRRRLKEDGINIAQWYSTLSLFLGLCLRKLPVNSQQIEGVLSFLYTKLVIDREALLITALSDVLKCVGDIEMESNLTAKQISAQGGGRYLRSAVSGVWGRIHPDVKLVGSAFDAKLEKEKKTAMRAMLGAFESTEMHVQIAIAIAQLTKESIYDEELRTLPLKLGANIIDRAKSSLLQLSQFMDIDVTGGSREKEMKTGVWEPIRALGISRMIKDMEVSTPSAIAFLSPILDYLEDCKNIEVLKESEREKNPSMPNSNGNGATQEQRANKEQHPIQGGTHSNDVLTKKDMDGDTNMLVETKKDSPPDQTTRNGAPIAQKEEWSRSVLDFAKTLSERSRMLVSPELIRVFWTLKLDDIAVPVDLYASEVKRLSSVRMVWENEVERIRRHAHVDRDRRRRIENEYQRIRDFIDSLSREKESFVQKQAAVLQNFRSGGREFCSNVEGTEDIAEEAVDVFIQECILPRCKVSITDALFCSQFVLLLLEHDLPVLNYSKYFECLLKLIPIALSGCTENEALSIARLVREVLTTLERWRSNRKVFESEASKTKKNGFRQPLGMDEGPLRHEQYCQWLFNIHENLTQGLSLVLISEEYLFSRNSLCVLAGIADVFPKVSEHAQKIQEHVARLCDSDLPDIRLSSTGVLARLKSGKAKRLPTHVFMLKPSTGGSNSGGTPVSKKPSEKRQGLKREPHRESMRQAAANTPSRAPGEGNVGQNDGRMALPMKDPHKESGPKEKDVESEKTSLDPNATEFIPNVKDRSGSEREVGGTNMKDSEKRGTTSGASGKRTRENTNESNTAAPQEGPRRGDAQKDQYTNQPPPPKRSRNAEGKASPGHLRQSSDKQRSEVLARETTNGSGPRQDGVREDTKGRPVVTSEELKRSTASAEPHISNARYNNSRGDLDCPLTENREGFHRDNEAAARNPGLRKNAKESQPRQANWPDAGTKAALDSNNKELPRMDTKDQGVPAKNASVGQGRVQDGIAAVAEVKRNGNRDFADRGLEKRENVDRGLPNRGVLVRENNARISAPSEDLGNDVGARRVDNRERPLSEAIRNDHMHGSSGFNDAKEGSGRDNHYRGNNRRGNSVRDSPGQNIRAGSNRETLAHDTNGVTMKDNSRRRKNDEPGGPYQHAIPSDVKTEPNISGHNVKREKEFGYGNEGHGVKREREYAHVGEGYGGKREREYVQPRNSYSLDGGERRSIRQRTDDGGYRERSGSREDLPKMNHTRRYSVQKSPSRDNVRVDGSFQVHGPAANAGWNEPGRSRNNAEGNSDGRGNANQGQRRRDDFDQNPGWKPRAPDRPADYSGRERPPSRLRDEGRRDNEYGYDERGGRNMYREGRRNSGHGAREDRLPRGDRGFQRRNTGGRSGTGRRRQGQ